MLKVQYRYPDKSIKQFNIFVGKLKTMIHKLIKIHLLILTFENFLSLLPTFFAQHNFQRHRFFITVRYQRLEINGTEGFAKRVANKTIKNV